MKLRNLRRLKKRSTPIETLSRQKKAVSSVRVCLKRAQPRDYKADSFSSNATYKVKYFPVADRWEWSCNCKAFIFKKVGVLDCKHIREVKEDPSRFCNWKSTVGPEQPRPGREHTCPRCGGATVLETPHEEEED